MSADKKGMQPIQFRFHICVHLRSSAADLFSPRLRASVYQWQSLFQNETPMNAEMKTELEFAPFHF